MNTAGWLLTESGRQPWIVQGLLKTVNAKGLWPQYEGTFLSDQTRWTYNAKLDHQLAQGQSLFFRYGAENEYRPIITAGTAANTQMNGCSPRVESNPPTAPRRGCTALRLTPAAMVNTRMRYAMHSASKGSTFYHE